MLKLPKALLPIVSLLVIVMAISAVAFLATATFGPRTADANPHAGQSVDVAVIDSVIVTNGGEFPTTTGNLSAFNFTNLAVGDVSAANLAAFDTVLLNVASRGIGCNISNLSASARSALVSFVGAGNKLIIYDSECTFGGSVDYSWLPFPFSTNNPGAAGAQGTLNIVEENTLSTSAAGTHFIDAGMLGSQTDAVGDMNVMVTLDPNWCLDMSGTNVNQVTGPVHAYARYGTVGSVGLIIYNGLDVDYLFPTLVPDSATPAGNLAKMWLQELQQPFNPDNLPCAVPVAGISLTPETATNDVGTDHTVTATITDLLGDPVAGVKVTFEITGDDSPNQGDTGKDTTAANGKATFTYTGDGGTGTDTIKACFFNEEAEQDVCDTATKEWKEPAVVLAEVEAPTISLSPETATNEEGEDHTVTATVTGADAGTEVTFQVTKGPNHDDPGGTDTTDADGKATFTYTGDGGTGTDTIQACVPVPMPEPTPTPTPTPEPTPSPTPSPTPAPTPTPTPEPPSFSLIPIAPGQAAVAAIGQPLRAADTHQPAQAQEEVCDTATKVWTAVEAEALPPTGGEPPDSGSSGLAWLVAIAGTIAVMGAGGFWLAYQRRRAR